MTQKLVVSIKLELVLDSKSSGDGEWYLLRLGSLPPGHRGRHNNAVCNGRIKVKKEQDIGNELTNP